MKPMYLYNPGTHTIHIEGYCHYAVKGLNLTFENEDEVLGKFGRSARMCVNCQKKRDQILREAKIK